MVVETTDARTTDQLQLHLEDIEAKLDQVFSFVFSRLILNSSLRKSRTELRFRTEAIIWAPFVEPPPTDILTNSQVLGTYNGLREYFDIPADDVLPPETSLQLTATLEGSQALIRPRRRDVSGMSPDSKGILASLTESQIAVFDQRQKIAAIRELEGVERIRGLAGSGKTVVLAMKAAITHLRNPEATILYTFYTRSLYQFIRRLITRFYREFDDRDPDWDKLQIMHAWGGYRTPGVYFNTCVRHGVSPLSYSDASNRSPLDPFGYICKDLMDDTIITPMFDYVFVDEGQDLPVAFLQLCVAIAEQDRMVYAYDDLQTIFQTAAPTPQEILGPGGELTADMVLYKCYRNPREIIVAAHALGFGIYGTRIVQLLENPGHWEDIGYSVSTDSFVQGDQIVIDRPTENSLTTISDIHRPNQIVQAKVYASYQQEIEGIVLDIIEDLKGGLQPDDILVVIVDDRYARSYAASLAEQLAAHEIRTNNMQTDSGGVRDFQKTDHVTMATVHRAKGNEAFSVYVAGVDALFPTTAGVRARNMLFTAMTRAKGWVSISGLGDAADTCRKELEPALSHFPEIVFEYPSEEQLKIMKRDLAERDLGKQRSERMLDQVLQDMSASEIKRFVEQRSISKGKIQRPLID